MKKTSKKEFDFQAGEVLLFDKPLRWTSFDVVGKVRNTIKVKKVGHAGTLDPLATGLLIVCTGKMTKQIEGIQGAEKEYVGQMVLGQTTPSCDLETEVSEAVDISHLTEADLMALLPRFTGTVMQVPPAHSAIKVNGKRAYESARKGQEIELQARPVEIRELELTRIELPVVEFRMSCSKGTYVRSFVRDFGDALGVGAYMSALCRTRIGEYRLQDAYSLPEFIDLMRQDEEEPA